MTLTNPVAKELHKLAYQIQRESPHAVVRVNDEESVSYELLPVVPGSGWSLAATAEFVDVDFYGSRKDAIKALNDARLADLEHGRDVVIV